jgi:hypothetical protein
MAPTGFPDVTYLNLRVKMVSREGLEPARLIEPPQVTDSTIPQKRQNRYFSRTEVHSGYTGY